MASGHEKRDCGVKGGRWSDETKPASLWERIGSATIIAVAAIMTLTPVASLILGAFD
jgi:hypothetical protein